MVRRDRVWKCFWFW